MARKWVHWTNEKLVIFSIKPSSHPFWEINSFDHTQILHTQHPDDRSLDAQRAESTRLRPFCGLGRGRFTERIDATRSLSAYLTNNYTPAKSQKLKLLYAIKPDCRHIFDADVRNATMCDTSNSQKNNKHWSSRRKWLSRAAERRLSTCAGGDFCRALAPRWKLSSQQNMMGYYLLMDITYDWAWMGMEYHQGGESKWMARQNQTPQKFCWTLGDLTRKSWPVAHQASHIRGLGRFCRELIPKLAKSCSTDSASGSRLQAWVAEKALRRPQMNLAKTHQSSPRVETDETGTLSSLETCQEILWHSGSIRGILSRWLPAHQSNPRSNMK